MQSRRDQVEAQTYLLSRLTGALVSAEPDAAEPPTRRDSRGIIGGAMVALLAVGVVAAFALFFAKGSTVWRQPGTLILDKSNGSRYLLLDGKLRPVLNLASAKLVVGSSLKTTSVKPAAIKDVPRGDPIGIPGAPDSLPQLELLNTGVWRVCATTPQTGLPTYPQVRLVTDIGSAASPARLGSQQGILVVADGQTYLVWQGQALRLAEPWVADVMGWGGVSPLPVLPTWLDLLEPGPDLAPIAVPDRGRPGPQIDGQATRIGQLFHVDAAGVQSPYYLLLKSGLSALTTTEYLLVSANTADAQAVPISAGALAGATRATGHGDTRGLPITPPTAVRAEVGLTPCLEFPGQVDSNRSEVVWAALPPAATPPGGIGALRAVAGGGSGVSGQALATRNQMAAPAPTPSEAGSSVGSTGLGSLRSAEAGPAEAGSASGRSVGDPPSPDAPSISGSTPVPPDNAVGVNPNGDRAIRVRPGAGVLIRVPQPSGGDADSLLLVNDAGTVFPLAGKEEVADLGYDVDLAVTVPGKFVQLLAGGTVLSATAAQ